MEEEREREGDDIQRCAQGNFLDPPHDQLIFCLASSPVSQGIAL
jgi:hypothetical protein